MDCLRGRRLIIVKKFRNVDFYRAYKFSENPDFWGVRGRHYQAVGRPNDLGTVLDAYWQSDATLDLKIRLDRGPTVWVNTSWPDGNGKDQAPLYIHFLRSPLEQLAECAE